MSSRPYVYQCHAWPTGPATVPQHLVAPARPLSTRLVFLTLTTIFLDIQTDEGGPPPVSRAWEFICPVNQLSELVRSTQFAICRILQNLPGTHIPALRDVTIKIMGCITDAVTNPDNSERMVLPIAALFSVTRISPTTALPTTVVELEEEEEEESEDEYYDEDEEEEEEEEEVKEDTYKVRNLEIEPLVNMVAPEEFSCSICLDDVEAGSIGSKLVCHHWFHEECVLEWLSYHLTCPNCRFRFDS